MLILTEQDIKDLITMPEVVDALEAGFQASAAGGATIPDRSTLQAANGVLLLMPGYLNSGLRGFESGRLENVESSVLGAKLVSVFQNNPARNLDVVQALYVLLDSETGVPAALMGARHLTAIRTAATSAVATKYLANKGPQRLAIFGAGVQAAQHIEAMTSVADVVEIRVTSRNREHAAALADWTSARYPIPASSSTAHEAITTSNLICTCTGSASPLFDGSELLAGAHINAVGAFTPDTRELDTETVGKARVFIDDQSAAGREAGELAIPIKEGAIAPDHVKGTLSDLVSRLIPGRISAEEITLFKSCGLALEDLVTAQLAYRKARESGRGFEISL